MADYLNDILAERTQNASAHGIAPSSAAAQGEEALAEEGMRNTLSRAGALPQQPAPLAPMPPPVSPPTQLLVTPPPAPAVTPAVTPAPAFGQPSLFDGGESITKALTENEHARAAIQGTIQRVTNQRDLARQRGDVQADAELENRQHQLEDLLEQYKDRPALPKVPDYEKVPTPPTVVARPFGTMKDSPTAFEALQNTMSILGLAATQFMGVSKGFARGANQAMASALEGWSEGDKRRGELEFANYKNRLEALDRTNRDLERRWHAEVVNRSETMDDLRTRLVLFGVQEKLGDARIAQYYREPNRLTEDLAAQTKQSDDLLRERDKLVIARAQEEDRQQARAEAAQKFQLDLQKFQAEQRRDAETERAHRADEAIKLQTQTQKPLSGPVAERLGSLQEAMTSRAQINAIRNNPAAKAAVDDYIGPVASRSSGFTRGLPLIGTNVPPQVIQLEQALANLRNNALKARSGASVTEVEQKRFDQEFPAMSDPVDIFWRKYEAVERNVAQSAASFAENAAPGRPGSIVEPRSPIEAPGASASGWGKAERVK